MNGCTFARVEPNPESPLLPFHQRLIRDSKRRTFRLENIEWLQVLPRGFLQQFGDIFTRLAMTDDVFRESLVRQAITFPTGCWSIDPDNLALMHIHDGDDGQRVCVKVGVWVLGPCVLRKDQSLKVTSILVLPIQAAIRPRIDDDFKSIWELELGESFLEFGRSFADLNKDVELCSYRDLVSTKNKKK